MMPDAVRLRHILDAANRISPYALDARDEKTLDAVIRQLAIIGEAVRHLSPALRKSRPEIPWKNIVGLRNLVIPILTPQIETLIKHLSTH